MMVYSRYSEASTAVSLFLQQAATPPRLSFLPMLAVDSSTESFGEHYIECIGHAFSSIAGIEIQKESTREPVDTVQASRLCAALTPTECHTSLTPIVPTPISRNFAAEA